MRLNARREIGDAPLHRLEICELVMVVFFQALRDLLLFVSRRTLHLMCQNLRHPETRPESLLPLANHRMRVICLTLKRSSKTVYSRKGVNIYVGECMRYVGECVRRGPGRLRKQYREFGSHYSATFSISLAAITKVTRRPHLLVDALFKLFSRRRFGHARHLGSDPDGDCDAARDFADGVHIGEERRHAVIPRGRHFAQCPRRRNEHFLPDSPRPRCDYAQSDSGEDVGVVALSDLARAASAGDRWRHVRKRAAGGDDRATRSPGHQSNRLSFGARGRVGERKDDRARDVAGHLLGDVLCERAGLSRRADERSRLQIFDHLGQRDVIAVGDLPIEYVFSGPRERPADLLDVTTARVNQASDINKPERMFRLLLRTTFANHCRDYLVGDARRSRPGAEHNYTLIAQAFAVYLDRRQQPGERDRARALNVVVETAQAILIAFEQSPRVVAREILPLQQRAGEGFDHGLDELLDEIVILLPAHSLVSPTDVERVLQQLLVARSDVEKDRQRLRRVNARAERVERQLAHWNAHSAHAQIAQSQHPLAVGHDDYLGVRMRRVREQRFDLAAMAIGDVEAARAAVDVTVELARRADHWRVDDRHYLGDVASEQFVEERFVTVLQGHQEDVPFNVRLLAAVIFVIAR